ncbi:MAG: class I SAM-dependent DNA methyltransferase [Candidatus Binatia bacterium]
MQVSTLLNQLGYADSPNFLRRGEGKMESAPGYGHIFRHAVEKCGLHGVYVLRPPSGTTAEPMVPVVYLCEATSDEEADKTHRLVWNQDVVPFVLIQTPQTIRLYSGFRYRRRGEQPGKEILQVLKNTNEVLQLAESFHADAIDEATIWRRWGNEVRPEGRVDWRLLENLQQLDQELQKKKLKPEISHALIGKYVYLHYLKDHGILSKRKLEGWEITEEAVFGREATLPGVQRLIQQLDDWLNGSVFPLDFHKRDAPTQEHISMVAATFAGDQPLGDGRWQLHLDFQAYDFSYIPIETLSVVYEQFLHTSTSEEGLTRGKEAGAYYTPIPVVNFMLAEMEDRHPLSRGMRILDPACGSGAFLVQCYRRLIEREYPPTGDVPGPIKLRELLQEHIFGVDRDPDACSVTELSLLLTLLDYCNPPDLEDNKRVKLPSLRDENIFHANFFEDNAKLQSLLSKKKFDWVVGNPPWKKLNPKKLSLQDKPVWRWMEEQKDRERPIGGNQVAQAFAWAVGECLTAHGEAGLLLPAMTLFDDPSREFRSMFFRKFRVHAVANFANFANVLFAKRSQAPAASFFYGLRPHHFLKSEEDEEYITTYTPLVANQEPTRPVSENTRQETWSLVLNASEIRDIPLAKVATGNSLPWKLATWGSELDEKLLRRLARQFPRLRDSEKNQLVIISQGLELRRGQNGTEEVEPVPEVIGKWQLHVTELEKLRNFFAFPDHSLKTVGPEFGFARKRGGVRLPLSVCRPPHVIVSAARNFAVYSEEFIVVPPRQIGIVSTSNNRNFLKALALFLSSDFVFYHLLTSTELGVKRDRATLNALRELPIPLSNLSAKELEQWVRLHDQLVEETVKRFKLKESMFFSKESPNGAIDKLCRKLNDLVFDSLRLTDIDRVLIRDLVTVKLDLNEGQLGSNAVRPPTVSDLKRYARRLKSELDGFIEGELTGQHEINVIYEPTSAMLEVELTRNGHHGEIQVIPAEKDAAAELNTIRQRLRKQWSQWVYFDRNLRVYEGPRTFVFKPMQRFHWTESQAISDASNIIAETIAAAGETD